MIVVDRVSKYYGERPAVRDLEFKIEEGECVGLLGLNGAGKTTTLRLLSCLSLPTSGRITVRGFDAEEQPHEIKKLIGYLPDRPPLYPEMSVQSFLRFAGKLRRMSSADVEKRLPEVIEATALEAVVDQQISTLSHGYKQRVGIAQAIIHRPTLLILDEPIQGLDPVQIVEMRELIRGLRGEHTILLSSHILSEVERTCDRLVVLDGGRIVAQGTEEEIAGRSAEAEKGAPQLIELEVRGEEEAVRAALEEIEGLEVIEIVAGAPGTVRVKTSAVGDLRETVAERIVTAKLGLLGLRRASTALEDIFVRLGQREEARA